MPEGARPSLPALRRVRRTEKPSRPDSQWGERHSLTSALPDDLLTAVFSKMELEERLRSPGLVCKRWHALCCGPALLHDVKAFLMINPWQVPPNRDGPETMRREHSLQAFLSRHADALRSLDLQVSVWAGSHTAAEAARVLDQPRRAMQVLAGPAWLERLRLRWDGMGDDIEDVQPTLNLVSKLSRLTALDIRGEELRYAAAPLRPLTALVQLKLQACSWAVLAAQSTQLPPSLTQMELACSDEGELTLSPQLSALTALHQLTLNASDETGSYQGLLSTLPCMHGLESLNLPGWNVVEAGFLCSLAHLPRLRALQLAMYAMDYEEGEDPYAQLVPALAQLTHLTALHFSFFHEELAVPASIGGLTGLQHLSFHTGTPAALPAGPWQHSLRSLATSWPILSRSRQLLEGADGLQELSLSPNCWPSSCERYEPSDWEWLWEWAERHGSLRHLHVGVPAHVLSEATRRLASSRPDLTIDGSFFILDF